MDFSALLSQLGGAGGLPGAGLLPGMGAGGGGGPAANPGMMKKMMENMSQLMSPDLMALMNNPELQELKSRPERLFGPGVNGGPVETGGIGDSWKRWKVIYPEYLDSHLTCREGRRLQLDACVPDVTIQEILRALVQLEFPYVFENKRYPRRVYAEGGRAKVDFAGNRNELYLAVAVAIMMNRQQDEAQALEMGELPSDPAQQAISGAPQQGTTGQQGGGERQPDGLGASKKRKDTKKGKSSKRTDR